MNTKVVHKDFQQRERIKAEAELAAMQARHPVEFGHVVEEMLNDTGYLIEQLEYVGRFVPNVTPGQVPALLFLLNKTEEAARCALVLTRMHAKEGDDSTEAAIRVNAQSYFPSLNDN